MREKEGEKQYSEYSTYILGGGGGGAASKKYYGIHRYRYTVAINPHKPYPKSEFNSSLAVVVVVLIMLCRRWPGTGVTAQPA